MRAPGPIRAGLTSLLLLSAACATPLRDERTAPDPLPVIERAANWQLAHMDRFDYVQTQHARTADPLGWVQGTFYVGLTRLADASRDPRYVAAIERHGQAHAWQLGARRYHADDHVIGQTWLWQRRRTGGAATIAPLRRNFDAVLARPAMNTLEFVQPATGDPSCTQRWCWCDALFMAPAAWAGLSEATGDPRYLDFADAEFARVVDYLYDREEHLFYRDSRYFTQRTASARKIFWSRGNGWVFAGLALMLERVPPERAHRYRQLFLEMAPRIRALQSESGYWPVSLLDPTPTPETSGTGFFVFGLAWGVNNGLLDAETYQPVIDRGWRALAQSVNAEGRLGWVQQVGYAPEAVTEDMTQLYGVAALLMAGSEISRGPRRVTPDRLGARAAPHHAD